jgi:ABC-type polysaccharide/polyol phosphate transport system ATPase subunit/ABC-type polysaccharide/polyol phosphate export permease
MDVETVIEDVQDELDGSGEAAIEVNGVSKKFRLPQQKYTTVKHRVLQPFAHRNYEVLDALEKVSFDVRRGETFAIVGRNGSGKSTLMKCIAGIYRLDSGDIEVAGRLAPFIELGVGFNPELPARDNVLLNATLLGLTPAQARARFDQIIAFAELEPFVDLKLKNFSSGMTVRLAFAVTTQVDAEVLLFDEVLKVGDAAFEEKCLAHFDRLKLEGRTIVLVTHDMKAVERHCDRAMLLDRGRVAAIGGTHEVARAYMQDNAAEKQPPRVRERARGRNSRRPRPRHRVQTRTGRPATGLISLPPVGRIATLTRVLAVAAFKLKYLDAWLSYLWILVKPLAFFGTLYFVFTRIGHLNQGIGHYPVYLLCALVMFFFFADACSESVYCLVANEPLLRRIPFPHVVLPLSVVAIAFFDLFMSAVAVLVFVLASGVAPRLSWLAIVPLVLLLTIVVAGTSMLLSALYVRFRDVHHIWGLARQVLFYVTPIFYVVASYPSSVRPLLTANPLAAIFTEFRHAVIDPHAPSLVRADGGVLGALVPVAVALAIFALGLWVFHRESPNAPENV